MSHAVLLKNYNAVVLVFKMNVLVIINNLNLRLYFLKCNIQML